MSAYRRSPWYERGQSADDVAISAVGEAQRLRDQYSTDQRWHTTACLRFYDGTSKSSILGSQISVLSEGASNYNVIQAVIDTFTSHIVKERVRPLFLTQKGSWAERRDAKEMGRAVEAVIHEAGLYGDEGTLVARDGCTTGTGVVKWTPDYENHRLLVERVHRDELFVDRRDAKYGRPRTLCHVQRIDRGVLLARFPDHSEAIETAPCAPHDPTETDAYSTGDAVIADQVEVAELWHLPSGYVDASKDENWDPKKAKHDGRHVCVLVGGSATSEPVMLMHESWPLDVFPFAFFRPKRRSIGFDGRGFVETLKDAQLQINRMLRRVDGIMALHSKMTVYLNRQAGINPARVTNDWAQILEGDGPAEQAIRHISPQSVSGDYIAQIERLISWCFQAVGLSELSVASEKPKGIESGVGLRTLLDTESIRHTDVFRAWESFFLELSRGIVEGLRLLARNDSNFTLVWGDDKELREVKWSMVDLDNSKWRLRAWPTNLLPSTPSAKLEKASEMYKDKLISQEQFWMMMDYPDAESILGDKSATQRNVERMLAAVEEGTDPDRYTPHGFMSLDMGESLGLERYNALESDGAPDEVLARMQRWIEDVRALKERAAASQAPQATAPAGPGSPPAASPPPPGAPPVPSLPQGPPQGPPNQQGAMAA